MIRIESEVSSHRLAAILMGAEARPKVVDGTGVLMLNGQWKGIPDWCQALVGECIAEIQGFRRREAHHVSINVLPPGLSVAFHVDPTPRDAGGVPQLHERWHLPLKTNPQCFFQDANLLPVHMDFGAWHGPVEYWNRHRVWNDGSTDRVHLIVDLL